MRQLVLVAGQIGGVGQPVEMVARALPLALHGQDLDQFDADCIDIGFTRQDAAQEFFGLIETIGPGIDDGQEIGGRNRLGALKP